ncbi:Gfo/Idh/MocA family oxidoreductase [Myroides marinus]|uniref:Gfo/Idh/MocA family protein n=1 Tax=Myroides marinus TaxID=703342 RepID=UPI0025780937|nr:Gfo/Idh/MocA family oxidoreductase [Myroides marinus]MDM1352177.1 Gfo/Idh/MocA family oxidoreductase [Myroides marinus]MDM1359384.1 Gfo/Idh/MocA family oxidoreductase [Myroides marinus]MDM1366507.1 Gfo/Idh/MocA family oxidoreductase [Myroides marinus]
MKVLIVGLGSIAKKHISAINQVIVNCEIFALRSSINSEKIEGVFDLYTVEECQNVRFDFIVISNPTSEHYNVIKELSKLKVPLFIEKPLFSEVTTDTDDLVRSINKLGIVTYVACNLRFLESLRFLKEIIKDERINEVNVYCGSYLPDWRPSLDFRKVYSANVEMGGGVHIDLIHELDYVYWLFGRPNNTVSNFSNKSSLAISANDYANYLWEYEEYNISIILNYFRRIAKRELEVVTDQHVFKVDLLKNSVVRDNEKIFNSDRRIIDTYQSQMRFFIEDIVLNKNVMNDINEANEILKLCMQE